MRHIRVATKDGVAIANEVKVASSFVSRLVGLLPRSRIDAQEGLWLEPGGSVHTLGMRFPIDVLFLNYELKVLKVAAHLRPQRFAAAPAGTRFVLELAAGQAGQCGVMIGTELVAGGVRQ